MQTAHLFLVEESELCRPSSDIIGDHPLDQDRLHPVDKSEIDRDVGESLGLSAPSSYSVQPGAST